MYSEKLVCIFGINQYMDGFLFPLIAFSFSQLHSLTDLSIEISLVLSYDRYKHPVELERKTYPIK